MGNYSKHNSLTKSPLKHDAKHQYSPDTCCILPTCLVPGSSQPSSAQRLSGPAPGRPPLVQSRGRTDTLPA